MRKVIFADVNKNFINDIQTKFMLEDYPVMPFTVRDISGVYELMAAHPDAIIMMGTGIIAQEDFDVSKFSGYQYYGYSTTGNDIPIIQNAGVPCVGVTKSTDKLLDIVCMDTITTLGSNRATPPVPKAENSANPVPQPTFASSLPQPSVPSTPSMAASPVQEVPAQGESVPNTGSMNTNGMDMSNPQMMQMMQVMMQMMQINQAPSNAVPPQPPHDLSQSQYGNPQHDEQDDSSNVSAPLTAGSKLRKRVSEHKAEEADKRLAEKGILFDNQKPADKKTVTVTVYAAKGGVGKTTIATETAVCLAFTSNGRRKFRVCVVDYNIDFGDVSSILELDERGNNMVGWATEIDERIKNGENLENINYTQKEMEQNYLQRMESTGLFSLVAPVAHEDSMAISSDALEVMLRNIIKNGNFDYVICDTGNNTRDGSIVAIDNSDLLMLVGTQDVTTANCNRAVIRTMEKTGFNADKVRLVVNNIISAREAGISVQEVEETFPYPCVCRIKRTPDVIKANNLGQPLVFKPNHEYTKQIQKIVAFITSGEILPEEEKKGLLGGLFKR